jgi:hypothetical protein
MKKLSDKLRYVTWQFFRQLKHPVNLPADMSKPEETEAFKTTSQSLTLNTEIVKKLMQKLENTREEEYSCEETFTLLDEFVELLACNEEAAALMPLVQHHLEECPDCRDEFEILLRILQTDSSPPSSKI